MYSSNKECIENEERPLMLPETPAGCLEETLITYNPSYLTLKDS